jgi:hypothetical protein
MQAASGMKKRRWGLEGLKMAGETRMTEHQTIASSRFEAKEERKTQG